MQGFLSTADVRPDMTWSPRSAPVLVALLLVVAAIAIPAAAAPDDPSAATALLTLDGQTADGFHQPSMDVATALAIGHERGSVRIDRYAFDERFAAVTTDDDRRNLLFEETTRLNRRITALRAETQTLRLSYRNGSIDIDAYVHGLVRLGTESTQLRSRLDRLDALSDQVPGLSYQGRIGRLDAALMGLDGPVRERARAAVRGGTDPFRLYASASADGWVLSMLEDGRYVREAYRADMSAPDATDGIGLDQAASRIAELYPEAYNTSIQRGINGLGGGVYRITITLQQGTLIAYLDGSTESVFFEVQEHGLATLPVTERVIRIENGTRLHVDRVVRGGPLRVETVDNETEAPVPSTILVGDRRLETGEDGVAWTLMPPSERVTVTAIRPNGTATVTVRPLPPQPVNQ